MNKNKIVEMYCPKCNTIVPNQPTVMIQEDGTKRLEMLRAARCPECNGGLQRKVTRIKKEITQ